ncbi:MAG: hypothetical protein RLZZ165_671 [Bacteroidota bacterium]
MKNPALYIPLLLLLLHGCQPKAYTPDKCLGSQQVPRTKHLAVSDIMPDFTTMTDSGKTVSLSAMDRGAVLLFFKRNVPKGTTRFLSNDEIAHAGIGELARKKTCDVLVTNDAKLSRIYGIELDDDASVKHGTLIVADRGKAIQKIYHGSCEDHIIELLNGM